MYADIIITKDVKVPLKIIKAKLGRSYHLESVSDSVPHDREYTISRGLLGNVETVSGIIEIPSLQGHPGLPDYMKHRLYEAERILICPEDVTVDFKMF